MVNDCRKSSMARRVIRALGGNVRGRKIAILGLTFKPNTDDMREAPSIDVIRGLQDAGAIIHAYDPEGMVQARDYLEEVDFAADLFEAARGASAVVAMTEWDEFRGIDLAALRQIMATPVLVDLRNIYSPAQAALAGLTYHGIGRLGRAPEAENVFNLHGSAVPEASRARAPATSLG
jgi:UDPglucose 6-dehydrogenase